MADTVRKTTLRRVPAHTSITRPTADAVDGLGRPRRRQAPTLAFNVYETGLPADLRRVFDTTFGKAGVPGMLPVTDLEDILINLETLVAAKVARRRDDEVRDALKTIGKALRDL